MVWALPASANWPSQSNCPLIIRKYLWLLPSPAWEQARKRDPTLSQWKAFRMELHFGLYLLMVSSPIHPQDPCEKVCFPIPLVDDPHSSPWYPPCHFDPGYLPCYPYICITRKPIIWLTFVKHLWVLSKNPFLQASSNTGWSLPARSRCTFHTSSKCPTYKVKLHS